MKKMKGNEKYQISAHECTIHLFTLSLPPKTGVTISISSIHQLSHNNKLWIAWWQIKSSSSIHQKSSRQLLSTSSTVLQTILRPKNF